MSEIFKSVVDWLSDQSPFQLFEHAALLFASYYLIKKLRNVKISDIVNSNPLLVSLVNNEIKKQVADAMKELFGQKSNIPTIKGFPEEGKPHEELLEEMRELQKFDADGHSGKYFAYIYHYEEEEHNKFVEKAFEMYMHENALNPMAFPSLRRFEVEVARMAADMLNGDENVCGSVTSGGTESILAAIKSYRDRARTVSPDIVNPNFVMPETGHPAFEKASHYFNVEIKHVPLNKDFTLNLEAYENAIDSNTILLVGSAPQYPHGIVDPITEIGKIAERHNLPLHVDACIGGYILPFLEDIGVEVPLWDFRVPQVTSISADVHKYGFCPKGASTLNFKNKDYRKYQYYGYTKWPGGLFVSPSLLGSRNGGTIASAWAALRSLGKNGFVESAKLIFKAFEIIKKGVDEIEDLEIIGNPVGHIVSFRSVNKNINILAVSDVMKNEFGWFVEKQQLPDSIHLTLMPPHCEIAPKFVEDLASSCEIVKKDPSLNKSGTAALYGAVAKINSTDENFVKQFLYEFMSTIYFEDQEESNNNNNENEKVVEITES